MRGWDQHEGHAVALPIENIDTDQLIPARFMSTPRSEGYGRFLLHDLREGAQDFPLDRHPEASVLVARRNFGSGSSREAAVYALVDAGFRVVIAPSFGDIFAGNAVNNGLLPAALPEDMVDQMIRSLGDGAAPVRVDLEAGLIRMGGAEHRFDLDPTWGLKLRNGWDDIDLTAQHSDAIAQFAERRATRFPWAWPGAKRSV
ncbi:3-isopropylmalate dehydratase small subunit [Cognatishimia sp. F0-27]|uniref:3-isopropylmalate dehydratase small subunit n=1 Tax=Cognatishimia sp. F0-27 TaxID=2816855 RepID=UPI001D0C5754|nr:3-isopropylmalate dehydratase small subunit [Cognatishimia sp. F0-27]MCC1491260.1 3-isopropylmalate dehydratase small subunit [Cognatishimia sp. F0-27]